MSLLRTYAIETDRVLIRCYQPADATMMSETILRNHEHLIPFMNWAVKGLHTVQFCANLIRTFRGNYDLGNDFPMAIFDQRDGRYIGGTGLHKRVGKGALEIGYWIDQAYCGQGFATHVSTALTKIGFEYEQVHRMAIQINPQNRVSDRVPNKLGYRLEGVLRQNFPLTDNTYADVKFYTMLREEYDASELKLLPLKAYGFDGQLLDTAPMIEPR